MQTFLPYADFELSARCLDNKRLGKQRVEAWQILNVLSGKSRGWKNHPAVLMWAGYEPALNQYLVAVIAEWTNRGFKNSIQATPAKVNQLPPWLGDEKFHASHRSNLLRKDRVHYSRFGWNEPDNLPYVWPIKIKKFKEASHAADSGRKEEASAVSAGAHLAGRDRPSQAAAPRPEQGGAG